MNQQYSSISWIQIIIKTLLLESISFKKKKKKKTTADLFCGTPELDEMYKQKILPTAAYF